MNITEKQLLQIILEEIEYLEELGNYSAAAGANIRAAQLAGNRDDANIKTVPVDDKTIKAIVSIVSKLQASKLNEEMLTEDVKEQIRNLVKRLGGGADAIRRVATRLAIPVALVASIAAGAGAGAYLAKGDSVAGGDDVELQVQDKTIDKLRIGDIAGTYYDAEKFSGMTNQQKIDDAWSNYDISMGSLQDAPVSSSVWIYKYKMIPPDLINDDLPLPLVGTTAGDYYKFLKDRVDSNPEVELPLLKNQVYGDVGKWAGGAGGGGNFKKAEDGSQILPPDWTIAYLAYADIMEDKTISLFDYHTDNPDQRQELYEALGVDGEQAFNKFVEDTLYKIGRPVQMR